MLKRITVTVAAMLLAACGVARAESQVPSSEVPSSGETVPAPAEEAPSGASQRDFDASRSALPSSSSTAGMTESDRRIQTVREALDEARRAERTKLARIRENQRQMDARKSREQAARKEALNERRRADRLYEEEMRQLDLELKRLSVREARARAEQEEAIARQMTAGQVPEARKAPPAGDLSPDEPSAQDRPAESAASADTDVRKL